MRGNCPFVGHCFWPKMETPSDFRRSLLIYRSAGAKAFAAGMAAYQSADCSLADEQLSRVAGFYKLASGQNAQTAQAAREECAFLLFGQEAEASGDYLAAISSYD